MPLNGESWQLGLDAPALLNLGRERRADYAAADPYPHIVLDNVLPSDTLDGVLADFPNPNDPVWKKWSDIKATIRDETENTITELLEPKK